MYRVRTADVLGQRFGRGQHLLQVGRLVSVVCRRKFMIPFFALFFTAFANGSAFAAVAPVINAPVDGSIIPKGPSDVICFVSADMQATSVAIKYKFTPTGGGATTTDTFMTNIGGPYWKQNMGKYQDKYQYHYTYYNIQFYP